MAHRSVHYEASFEDYLRGRGWPYVAVDEAKKAIFADSAIKSFDFLVYSETGANLLVDVKGRTFPDSGGSRRARSPKAWENWITRDDVEGLAEWEKVFGPDFAATLVFAYWLQGPPQRSPFDDVHVFRQFLNAGTQAARAPHHQADLDAGCGRPVQRGDDPRVDESVDLGPDETGCFAAVLLDFTFDEGDETGS